MKESDIRPVDIDRENARLYLKDIKDFLKSKSKFVRVSCPVCKSNKSKLLFSKNHFRFEICQKCTMVYINPRPSLDLLERYYQKAENIKQFNDKIFPLSEVKRRKHIFVPRVKKIIIICKKHKVSHRNILDIGAGFGTFGEEMLKTGYFKKVFVNELSPDLAESCRKKGLTVIEKAIEDVRGVRVDVITCFELIEHLNSPQKFLKVCSNLLLSKGLLIITTPNIYGFDLLTLGIKSPIFGGPNHLNYFHPESITMLLEKYGFEVVEISTPGKLDADIVRNNYLYREINLKNEPFIKYLLIDKWDMLGKTFQNFLSRHLLSSHMWVVARKIL